MKVRVYSLFSLILISLFLGVSCEKIGLGRDYDRVVLLYLAANNNLSTYAKDNVAALRDGYVPSVNDKNILLVYKHIKGEKPELVRMYKDQNGLFVEDIVAFYEDHNSASPEVLKGVLTKIKTIFPADNYGVILWSHASGWLPQGYYGNNKFPGVRLEDPFSSIVKSFGEDRGVEMEVSELRDAIPYKLEFLIFDCCFMGGIEVAYELRKKADYIMASPTEILATGFPYESVMLPLFEYRADLEEVANIFYNYYVPKGDSPYTLYNSATIALYDTDEIEDIAVVCEEIFTQNREKMVSVSRSSVQPYFRLGQDYFFDLEHYISKIATPSQLLKFQKESGEAVILKKATKNFLDIPIDNFSGLSVYIPEIPGGDLETFYRTFEWNQRTKLVN